MSINRELWYSPFADFPKFPCPSCSTGRINVVKDTFKIVETGESIKNHKHRDFDPDWIEERFSAILICDNSECKESVSVCGETKNMQFYCDDVEDWGYEQAFIPRYFCLSPPIFPIPKECPKEIANELKKAFSLFWSDYGASANSLRIAVELLLNERKVKKTTINKNNKRVLINLHDRIVIFKKENPEAANFLLAIKWLGNVGSHNKSNIGIDELLTGFEFFEDVIDMIYVQTQKRKNKTAGKIIKSKGRKHT